jgi:hypothetical protein
MCVRACVYSYEWIYMYVYYCILILILPCTLQPVAPVPLTPPTRDVPWEPIFTRLVHMMAAAEGGILHQSNPRYTAAIADATQGIPLTDGTLVYDQTCGLDVVMRGGHIAKP